MVYLTLGEALDAIEWCARAYYAIVAIGGLHCKISAKVFLHIGTQIQAKLPFGGRYARQDCLHCRQTRQQYNYLVSSIIACAFVVVVGLCGPRTLPFGVTRSTSVHQSVDKNKKKGSFNRPFMLLTSLTSIYSLLGLTK